MQSSGQFIWVELNFIGLILLVIDYINFKQFDEYKLKPNVTSVFIGDSHIQLSIDDNIIPNCINVSQIGEPYCFTYIKIKNLLKNNPSINNVYLGFSYHNLSSFYDDYIYGKYCNNISSKYFFILSNSQKFKFIKVNSNNLSEYLKNILKKSIKKAYTSNSYNRYVNTSANNESMKRRIFFQFYSNNHLNTFSKNNLYYLQKIIMLCKNKKINLELINTPLHPYFRNKIPLKFINKYNDYIIANKLKIIDLQDLKLNNDCYTPDGDHVSRKGQSITSHYIISYLEKNNFSNSLSNAK